MVIRGRNYDCCSACSDRVVQAYRQGGWEFVKRALNEKGYVEELSGLAEVCTCAALNVSIDIVVDIEDRSSVQLKKQMQV